jgi:hypothetical protein
MPVARRSAARSWGDAGTCDAVEGAVEMAKIAVMPKKRPGPILRLFSTDFTAMVNCGDILPSKRVYPVTRGAKRKAKPVPTEGGSVRATISFPSEIYQTLEEIAGQKKVSLAWVVREASEQYIADKWPLFKGKV